MEKKFTIVFDLPLDHSAISVQLTAEAILHHSSPYYRIDSFHLKNETKGSNKLSILPPVEIELMEEDGKTIWVHRDSKRSSALSVAIGKAIDEKSNPK